MVMDFTLMFIGNLICFLLGVAYAEWRKNNG